MPDLRDLLEEVAPVPRGPVPLPEIVRRARRRTRTARVAGATVLALAFVVAVFRLPAPVRQPVVDQPPVHDDASAPADVAFEITMHPGFGGAAADTVAQRLDPAAIPGSAEVLTWSENGLGVVHVVRYRTDRGEVVTEEDGEEYLSVHGPHCLAVTAAEGETQPDCDRREIDPHEFPGLKRGGGYCEALLVGMSVSRDAHRAVLDLTGGSSISALPHDGLIYFRYPGYLGRPETTRTYDEDGALLATFRHPVPGSSGEEFCAAEGRAAAWHSATSIEVSGDRQGLHTVDRVRSVRTFTGGVGELRTELLSLSEGVALRLRLPLGSEAADRTRAELVLPTQDPVEDPPVFLPAEAGDCTADIATEDGRVRGEVRCQLVSKSGEAIAVRVDVDLTAADRDGEPPAAAAGHVHR